MDLVLELLLAKLELEICVFLPNLSDAGENLPPLSDF